MNAFSGNFGKLDAMDYGELFEHVTAHIQQHGNRVPAELADTLDTLFTVKFVRLMRTPLVPPEAILDLDGLIGRICRDAYRGQFDAFPAHYAARWQMLRDAIAAHLRIEEASGDLRRAPRPLPEPVSKDPWELVAEQVLSEGREVSWSSVKELLRQRGVGPQSGGGVSQLLSAMRAHGWIDALQLRGNKSLLVAGRNIAQSRAWQSRQGGRPAAEGISLTRLPAPGAGRSERATHRFAEFARRGMSFNQAALLDFMHVANEQHRAMRLTLERFDAPGKRRGASLHQLFEATLALSQLLSRRTQQAAQQNFELLRQYFHDRDPISPRMSLVLNWQRQQDNDILTYAVARDSLVDYPSSGSRINENTGFAQVAARGTYYLNNNIPSSILDGSYANPRLDNAYVARLRERYSTDQRGTIPLSDWSKIWGEDCKADPRSCYQSTLIVPLALRRDGLSDEFDKVLQERLDSYLNEIGKESASQLILGFLCFDHPRTEYFNADEDVDVGHVFASLLSLYLFNQIMLTNLSSTFTRCLTQFSDSQRKQVQLALVDMADAYSAAGGPPMPHFDLGATTPSALFRIREAPM